MVEGCISLYELLEAGPNPYAVTMSYILLALPIIAGFALLAKRLKGHSSSRIVVGIISAIIWAGLLTAHWVSPAFGNHLLPQGLNTLVFALLFTCTMLDWAIQAFRSRLRPQWNDALVIFLIAALPVAGYAASNSTRTVCENSFQETR